MNIGFVPIIQQEIILEKKSIKKMELSDIIPPKALLFLKKLIKVLMVITMIYFGLGALACLGMIGIEAFTQQMSLEIKVESPEFQAWIIYVGMTVMLIVCLGFIFSAYLLFKYLKNDLSKEDSLAL